MGFPAFMLVIAVSCFPDVDELLTLTRAYLCISDTGALGKQGSHTVLVARFPLPFGGLLWARVRSPPFLSSLSENAPLKSSATSSSMTRILILLTSAVCGLGGAFEVLENLVDAEVRVGVDALLAAALLAATLPRRSWLLLGIFADQLLMRADCSSPESAFR